MKLMNSRLMKCAWIVFTIALIAAVIYMKSYDRRASASLHDKIKAYVAKYPELQPSYDRAMSDGKLTIREAQDIVNEGKSLKKQGKPDVEEMPETEE
jgi:hypothetical protein